ncbi:IS4 family transposase, partial [Amycolatopsis sp. NPDC059657]|uniref:IS4 family transposase n=1 Tax=Amycolatopsis sp. NPDC059657 TaxID=3346899 RepID=UPI003670E3C2
MPDSAMPVSSSVFLPGHLGVLTDYVPPQVIDEILAQTRRTQRRVRLLPARVVVYFVLALTLFPGRGYGGVFGALTAGADTEPARTPGIAALRAARARLGVAPLRALWDWACGPIATRADTRAWYRRWRLVAWDGTTLDVPDTVSNAHLFGRAGGKAGPSGYRKLQLLGLVECGTRAFLGAVFGGKGVGEITLARDLLTRLEAGMLLLADRCFYSWPLWHAAAATGADLLWRAKNDAQLPVHQVLPDGSYLSRFPHRKHYRTQPDPLPVRVINATITVRTADGTARTELYRLITTITDHRNAPAQELTELYARRWIIETTFYCWKVLQRGANRVLRSRTHTGVEQEVYAYLITYQALRRLAQDSADAAALDINQVSFTATLHTATDTIITHRGPTDEGHARATHRAARNPNPQHRRSRQCPRARKRPTSPFPSKRPGTPPSQTVTYTATLLTPHPTP